jgi:hypothetical protein
MNYDEFATKVKDKYPQYKDMDNKVLAQKLVAKYPQYKDVTFEKPSGFQNRFSVARAAFNALPDSPSTQLQKGLKTLGGNIAEKGGMMGYPKTGVALGVIPTFFPEALSMLSPGGPKISALKPLIPEARQESVAAARELGIPLTRAEQTGGMLSSGFESAVEKTPLGARPMQQFREKQAEALQAAKSGLQGKMGTQADLYSVGQKAIAGLGERGKTMVGARDALFSQVPDNVHIAMPKAKSMADTLLDEQSRLYEGTRNPEVLKWSKIVSKAESSTGKGVTGGPEFSGTPGGRVMASVGPESKFAPKANYYPIKKLRENLGEAIGAAKNAGKYQEMRDLTRLKGSLDEDINSFASAPASPLDSMVAKEFKANYKKANAFSGAYKGLFRSDEALQLGEMPPEKVVDAVFKRNNETAIKRFHARVGDKGFQPAKQRFTQDLLDSKNVAGELKKYSPGTLNAIYSKPELADIRKYSFAQTLAKGAEKIAGNPSGTGRQVTNVGSIGGAGYALGTGHPVAAAGILGGPYLGAKAYLSNALSSGVQFDPQIQRIIQGLIQATRRKAIQPQINQ